MADLGEVVIIALTLWGLVWFILRPLLQAYITVQNEKTTAQKQLADAQRKAAETNTKLLAYLEKNETVVERNTAAMTEAKKDISAVATKQEAHTDVLVQLVKTLPETVAQIVRATESAATRTIEAVNANTDKHDAEYKAALDEVKTVIEELRNEIAEGHKALRGDVLGRLDKVLSLLTPPPTEPRAQPDLKVA